jgi:hypothetical protein
MVIFRHLADWAFTRLFWLCLLGGTAQADVITLWDAPISTTQPAQAIAAGETASTYFDLLHASYVERLTLVFSTPSAYATTGTASLMSVWLDTQPGSRDRLLYSGYVVPGVGVSEWLPSGRHWITVQAQPGSRTFLWRASDVGAGQFTSAAGQTVQTAGLAGLVRGTPVPEPGAVVLLLVCCAAGIFYAWRGRRGDK